MTNNFNVVTALQTIHEHVHAVGCGCIPSDWTTPDTFIVSDGYNLSWRYPAAYVPEPAVSEPESSSIWDLL